MSALLAYMLAKDLSPEGQLWFLAFGALVLACIAITWARDFIAWRRDRKRWTR